MWTTVATEDLEAQASYCVQSKDYEHGFAPSSLFCSNIGTVWLTVATENHNLYT